MALARAHKKFADILIDREVAKLTGGKKPSRSAIKAAKDASFAEAFRYDVKARSKDKNYRKSWSTATAKKVVQAIERIVPAEVRAIQKSMKKAETSPIVDFNFDAGATAMGAMFGLPAAAKAAPGVGTINRRKMIIGLGSVFAGTALMTGTALADNDNYIARVKRDVTSYVRGKKSAIQKALRAG